RVHAGRRLAGRPVVVAEVALGHVAGLDVELGCGVRAGPLAVPTAHALVLVDEDGAVLALGHGRGRAHLDAHRVLAVVARDGGVVGEDVGGEGVPVLLPGAAGV